MIWEKINTKYLLQVLLWIPIGRKYRVHFFYSKFPHFDLVVKQQWLEKFLRKKAWAGRSDVDMRSIWQQIKYLYLYLDDIKVYAAVATSWDTYYPKAERGLNLHNIALEGMKDVRIMQAQQQQQQIDASKVSVTGIIDIALNDNKGNVRKLSDLKGKVVLLDFHMFSGEGSLKRIMMLRELYNKYHAQGFEIYQVSLDPDEHFWKTQTAAIPWISVRDENGTDSQILAQYNVQSIPTFFIIGKDNVLKKRDAQIKDLDAEIKSLL